MCLFSLRMASGEQLCLVKGLLRTGPSHTFPVFSQGCPCIPGTKLFLSTPGFWVEQLCLLAAEKEDLPAGCQKRAGWTLCSLLWEDAEMTWPWKAFQAERQEHSPGCVPPLYPLVAHKSDHTAQNSLQPKHRLFAAYNKKHTLQLCVLN